MGASAALRRSATGPTTAGSDWQGRPDSGMLGTVREGTLAEVKERR